jgi:transposase-like protein
MKVKNMKPSGERKKKKKVLRCPQCGSDDITYELGLITGYKYHCKKCQYVGVLVVEDEDEGK